MSLLQAIIAQRRRDSLDSDAAAYIAALVSAGVSPDATQQAAIDAFVVGEKSASRWDTIKRLYLPIWANASANAICLRSLASGTFVGGEGVTHSAGFAENDALTGCFLSDTSLADAGLTPGSGYLFQLSATAAGGFSQMGAGTAASYARLFFISGQLVIRYLQVSADGSLASSIPDDRGIVSFSRHSGTRKLYSRTSAGRVLGGSSVSADIGTPPISHFAMVGGWNSSLTSTPSVTFTPSSKVGAMGFGTGLSDADDAAFTLALKTLWETCAGLSLP